jgi:hypothetical protein
VISIERRAGGRPARRLIADANMFKYQAIGRAAHYWRDRSRPGPFDRRRKKYHRTLAIILK